MLKKKNIQPQANELNQFFKMSKFSHVFNIRNVFIKLNWLMGCLNYFKIFLISKMFLAF